MLIGRKKSYRSLTKHSLGSECRFHKQNIVETAVTAAGQISVAAQRIVGQNGWGRTGSPSSSLLGCGRALDRQCEPLEGLIFLAQLGIQLGDVVCSNITVLALALPGLNALP